MATVPNFSDVNDDDSDNNYGDGEARARKYSLIDSCLCPAKAVCALSLSCCWFGAVHVKQVVSGICGSHY